MALATSTHSLTPSASNGSISSNSRACAKADSANSDSFPAGLRVLVVDDDPICLLILDRMLRRCQYQVTTCGIAKEALAMLRENRDSFDVIISDVCMPDMDGFKLLELVGLEMDLPVIMMSANGETSAVMKGIKHGACDYLLKPVRMEELRNIWQHVVRRKWRSPGPTASHEDGKTRQLPDDGDHNSSVNEGLDGTWKQSKKRKDIKEEEEDADLDNDDSSTTKKPRVVWSVDLHQQFVNAVNQLGIDKAVPKRILELMNVNGLTRENVASHLQKYRLYLKRISGVAHQSGGLNPSFPVTTDSNFGPVSAAGLAGMGELRTLTGPSQLSPQALVSTLQAGILGRLGPANNLGIGNLDPLLLLEIAALQGASNGALASLPSYGQPLLNDQGAFPVGQSDVNQLQVSQLGAYAGSHDKGPPGLSALQQQQLAAAATLGGMGQLAGANNLQQVSSNANALLMQALQQQQVGGHVTSKGGLTLPTSGIVGQQALSTDAGVWAASMSNLNGTASIGSGITGQNSGSSTRLGSVPSLVGPYSASNVIGPLGRTTDAESKGLHITNTGNVAVVNSMTVSSPLASSGLDDLSVAKMKDMGSSLPPLNEGLPQSFGSKFALFSGLKQGQQGQGLHTGHRTQGPWQGFGLSQEYGQVSNSPIRSPSYNQASSGSQNLNLQEQVQLRAPGFSTGFSSNFDMDNGRVKAFQIENVRAESSLKVKEEGHGWLPEPLSDELFSIVLKQQQEGLGLPESEPGGPDGYAMDNMYVK